jgi:hypothetical protein
MDCPRSVDLIARSQTAAQRTVIVRRVKNLARFSARIAKSNVASGT